MFKHLSEHYEGFRHVDTEKVLKTAVFSHGILSQILLRGFLENTDGFPFSDGFTLRVLVILVLALCADFLY